MSNEQSIRDDIAVFFRGLGLTDDPAEYGDGIHGWRCEHPDRYGQCDCFEQAVTDLLASPVIRRIQAEALREAADDWHEKHAGTRPVPYLFMVDRADRIERGETA